MGADIVSPDDIVILVMTNIEEDDLSAIIGNFEFSENLLLVCDNKFIKNKGYKTNFIFDRLNNTKKLLAKLNLWRQKHRKNFVGIIGLDEEYRYCISESIAKKFLIDYYSRETLDIASNKLLQKNEFKKFGVAVPSFKLIGKKTKLGIMDFPNVIKITTGISSRFVYLNNNKNDLRKNIAKISGNSRRNSNCLLFNVSGMSNIKTPNPKNNFLLEKFVEGDEYSCDFIIDKSKAEVIRIAKKIPAKGQLGLFDALILFNPDFHEECGFKVKDIAVVCNKVAKAFRINSGVCMVDFKFNKEIFVIEASVRPGISTFIDLMAEVYGFTSINRLIRQKLNLPFAAAIPSYIGMAVNIFAPRSGLLKKFDTSYIEKHSTELSIIKIVKYYKLGERVIKIDNDLSVGYVLLKNINLKHADEIINKIRSSIIVEVSGNKHKGFIQKIG